MWFLIVWWFINLIVKQNTTDNIKKKGKRKKKELNNINLAARVIIFVTGHENAVDIDHFLFSLPIPCHLALSQNPTWTGFLIQWGD